MTASRTPSLSRRIAAISASALLVVGLVLLTVFLFSNFWYLVLSWVGLLGGVAAFARVLRARGAIQWVWLAVALAGLVLVVVAVLLAGFSNPWLLALILVLELVTGVLGRFALREPVPTGVPLRARRPVLLVNPRSGDGKAERTGLAAEAEQRGISVHLLEPGDDLTELARSAIANGADVIGIAGGDGSLGYVATAAIETGVPFVCVPAGTRNHFARDLGLDRTDVVGALDAFSGVVRRIDYATVNGRVFLNNASLGLYAAIVSDPAYRDAKAETTIATMEKLEKGGTAFDLRYHTPTGNPRETADLIFIGNNPYVVSGLPNDIGKRERLDGGTLGVLTLTIRSSTDLARLLAMTAIGTGAFPGWEQWATETFRVDSGSAVAAGIDGESVSLPPPVEFTVHPGGLAVAVPRGTPIGPGMGMLSSEQKLSDLWRIARGRAVAEA